MEQRIKIGIIGCGRMGSFYLREMLKNPKWEVVYVCDIDSKARAYALALSPHIKVIEDENLIFTDTEIKAVGLFTLANKRLEQIKKSVENGKHIISEKPIAESINNEWEAVHLIENSNLLSTVNLYLRNSWYHAIIKDFVKSGEIGDLAIIRVCHMTPGLAPGEGHEFEGPAFHDCGMHYVDITRWYAECDFKTWHAQGIRMWNYKDPWWIQCHGTFENGVVFDITQGFVYGQLSKDQTHNSYIDIIGTKGIARMTHDFKTAVVELHGINHTERIEKPFGGKNIDVLCDLFADSILDNKLHKQLPLVRDSAISSEFAWRFFEDALSHDMPVVGDLNILEEIIKRRRNMTNGYGLLQQRN